MLTPNDEAGRDWSRGWTVYVDRDNDRQPGEGLRTKLDDTRHGPAGFGLFITVDIGYPARLVRNQTFAGPFR